MAQVKTSGLSGYALDWAVAKAEGLPAWWHATDASLYRGEHSLDNEFSPSTKWAQGGPIIDREGLSWHCGNKTSWHAYAYGSQTNHSGPTPLIAAMRCFVASKLGDVVDVPQELL